jgi:D-alanine-D-alanine ligase
MQLAGIPCVGPDVASSAVSMDKTLTKLVVDHIGQPQAAWMLVRRVDVHHRMENILAQLQEKFSFPMFVKPAGTGSSVGVSKAADAVSLQKALLVAAEYDEKVLVEEFIRGREVEVAVMGNDSPIASICGEIDSGAEFYDYDAKYITDTSVAYIPARIDEDVAEQVRDAAVKIYSALGCRGLSRVDFFVTYDDNRMVFNEINTLPGFTSISMYPKLFEASGVEYGDLLDRLLELAMEADA